MKSLYLPRTDNCTSEYAKLVRDVEKLNEKQYDNWCKQNNKMSVMEIYAQADHVNHIEDCIDLLYDWINLDQTELAFKLIEHAEQYKRISDCIKNIIYYLENSQADNLTYKQLKVKNFLWSK